jgi:hypothetical protein
MRIFMIVLILIVLVAAGLAVYVYFNRQALLDKGVDKMLQDYLPDYVEIDDLKIDLNEQTVLIKGFRIRNPAGFSSPYLVEIENISAGYRPLDEKNILKGLSLSSIELFRMRVFLERDSRNTLNIQKMESVLKRKRIKKTHGIKASMQSFILYLTGPVKNIDQFLKIHPVFNINNGALFFRDFYIDNKQGYPTSVENIQGTITLGIDKDFKSISHLASQGRGLVNARPGQFLNWEIEYDPAREKLSMSNTFDIDGVDFTHFQPYYDKFSPFIFHAGLASGRLVFNFQDAEISSTNEVFFSGLDIEQKQDHSFNRFWPSGIDDLYRYFSSEQGDIVFDFKIKGPMAEPKFYLGSKTKRALTYMVVQKVAGRIFRKEPDASDTADSETQPESGAQEQKRSRLDDLLDIFKNF